MRDGAPKGRTALEAGVVLAARAVASVAVLSTGFLALSDDDYARVLLAERWAVEPKLDPTGTSWLPFPFWLTGEAMRLFGRSLEVARGVAIVLGLVSAVVTYVAARWLLGPRRGAVAAAGLAMLLPGAAVLGVATVPELFTAALSLLGLAAVASGAETSVVADEGADPARRRVIGAAALLVASLSRYEPWPIAAGFVALSLFDATRARREGRPRAARLLASSAAIAAAGPLLWLAWNERAHGDPFSFARRVAAYRRALGEGGGDVVDALFEYLGAALRAEAAVIALAAIGLVIAAVRAFRPPDLREHLARHARPAALCGVLVAALAIAAARDGAPTHHPERALLVVVLWAALFAVHVHLAIARHARGASMLHLLATVAALALASWAAPAGLAAEETRRRADHEAIGRAARAVVPPGAKLLVEVEDYGHLAVTAAFGRPEDVVPDRDIDPRASPRQDAFHSLELLAARIVETSATHVVARNEGDAVRASRARPLVTSGAWGLWRAADVLASPGDPRPLR